MALDWVRLIGVHVAKIINYLIFIMKNLCLYASSGKFICLEIWSDTLLVSGSTHDISGVGEVKIVRFSKPV